MNSTSNTSVITEKASTVKYVGFILLLGIALAVGLTIAPALGAASTETNVQKIPLEGAELSGNCQPIETVKVDNGNFVFVTHTTTDANGGFHGKAQINFVNVRGTGETNGDEYHIQSSFSTVSYSSEDGSPTTQTASGTTHITDGIDEKGHIVVTFTVNANGEVKVDDVKFKVDCV